MILGGITSTSQQSLPEEARAGWFQDLVNGFRELLGARNLVVQLAARDIRIRHKEAVMGFAWAILNPVLIVLSGVIVRIAMSQATGGHVSREAILNLGIKGLAWGYFAGAVSTATNSLTSHAHLLSKVYFPRMVLPLSADLGQAFDSCMAAGTLALFLPWLGVEVSTALLWVPVLLLLLVVLTLGLSLFLSCANVLFRDVKHIVQVLITFGIFFTPVFYEPAMLGERGVRIVMLNPLSPLLEGLRLALGTGQNLAQPLIVATDRAAALPVWLPQYLWYSAAWALGALFLGALLFRRTETRFAELV